MNKAILFATDLNIWSMKKGVGAPSFYKTLQLYNHKGFTIYLYTTEKNCDIRDLENITIVTIPKLKAKNIKYFYSFHRTFNYLLYQLIFLYYLLKYNHLKKVHVLYGYEIEFIPVLHILSKLFNIPLISRFQGTILLPLMNKSLWKLRYFPHYLSIKLKSTLTIMTDDGTKGNIVIKKLRNSLDNVLFLKNGIGFDQYDLANISTFVKQLSNDMNQFKNNFISVSRLEKWKRVDRSLNVYDTFKKYDDSSRFIIVGDGELKANLEKYTLDKNIQDVIFTGGINADEVNYLLFHSNIFLSHYELSNVGNPLWEAMNNRCLVVTIDNGNTGAIIQNRYNGIISDEDHYLDNAQKLIKLSKNEIERILLNADNSLKVNIKSWDERMEFEYIEVEKCIS